MATNQVYTATTAPKPKSSILTVPSEDLDKVRFGLKVFEVLMSLVAFVLEEVVNSCTSCSPLYFFEFVSCSAFLFTLLLLILLSTTLRTRVAISCWQQLDFVYTTVIAVLFLIASITFAADNGDTAVEKSAVVFGFLATLLFFADVGLFLNSRGLPFKRDGRPAASNNVPVVAEPSAETEKLNSPAE